MSHRNPIVWINVIVLLLFFPFSVNTTMHFKNPKYQTSTSQFLDKSTVPFARQLKELAERGIFPNEFGNVIIVMFHDFRESYKTTSSGNQAFLTTFRRFELMLAMLHKKKFQLVSLTDFLNNRISIPAGKSPIVFTFDDGTFGQFNLVKIRGELRANPKSAVGIMEAFHKKHPEFGLAGTFYVNLGFPTFKSPGNLEESSLAQRLQYLIDKGFEIGNHTYSHANLSKAQTAREIIYEIGKNQKKLEELIPNYKMTSLALPFGKSSTWRRHTIRGVYEGVVYENHAILNVGSRPSSSPSTETFNLFAVDRVRSPGQMPVQADLNWWLNKLRQKDLFISDGDPSVISIPQSHAHKLASNFQPLRNMRLVIY